MTLVEHEWGGVVLPGRLGSIFAKLAVRAGLAESHIAATEVVDADGLPVYEVAGEANEVELKQKRIAAAMLSRRIRPRQKQLVLEGLLLFGKALIPANESIDFRPLIEQGLVELLPPLDYDGLTYFDEQRAQLARPLFDSLEWSYHRGRSTSFHQYFDKLTEFLVALRRTSLYHPVDFEDTWARRIGFDFDTCLWAARMLWLALQDAENYRAYSASYRAPILIEDPPATFTRGQSPQFEETLARDHISVFKVYLDETAVLPRLQSVSDVLRLSRHPALADMRAALREWTEALRNGRAEVHFRKAIRESLAELARANRLAKTARFLSYLSLPVSVASYLSGIPAGLSLAPLSFALRVGVDSIQNEHRWVAFGR